MSHQMVLQMILFLPSLVSADCFFSRQNGRLLNTTHSGLVGARAVKSTSQCERYCLEHLTECLAANMVPIRRGLFGCELINQASLQYTQPYEGGIFILKTGKHVYEMF